MIGQLLDNRYQITAVLAAGGFGQTYTAIDTRRPGSPICVVKQLKPQRTDPAALDIARRLFWSEAETLEQLGQHPQIPRLLAYFEDQGQFYLVQEFIDGSPLSEALPPQAPVWSEAQVVSLLQELLPLLSFVHSQEVIHRDIKPDNLIRRQSDGQLVMIDFGTVKQVRTQLAQNSHGSFTVAVGTPGYMPGEQSMGKPRYNSDLYATGMMAIQALTGVTPDQLQSHPMSGEIIWRDQVSALSSGFADWLDQVVRYDFRQRFMSTEAALKALNGLAAPTQPVAQPTLQPSAQPTVAMGAPLAPLSTPPSQLSTVQAARQKPAIAASLQSAASLRSTDALAKSSSALQSTSKGCGLVTILTVASGIAVAMLPLGFLAIGFSTGFSDEMYRTYGQHDDVREIEELILAEDYVAAEEIARNMVRRVPDNPDAHGYLARTLRAQGRTTEARSILQNRLTSTSSRVQMELGYLAVEEGNLDEADTHFRRAVAISPRRAKFRAARGLNFIFQNELDEAEGVLRRAVRSDPESQMAQAVSGMLFVRTERYAEAETSLRRALELSPEGFPEYLALNELGVAIYRQQRYDEAIEFFRQSVALEPEDPSPHHNFGDGLAVHQARYAEAEAPLRTAIRLNPNDPDYHDSLGRVLEGLGRNSEAQESFAQARQLANGGNPQ
jgi:serine/threonine protein kinase/Flp pilus assembly protein TadD